MDHKDIDTETILDESPQIMTDVVLIPEFRQNESADYQLDCDIWPLKDLDLEKLTGIIESDVLREPEHESNHKQKYWKEEAKRHEYNEEIFNKHLE